VSSSADDAGRARSGATAAPRAHLGALYEKLEALFAAARARHGEALTCKAGCSSCCERRFSVTAIEAEVIREALAALATTSSGRRVELARRALDTSRACPALDPDGRCAIYEARPAICRTHGLPIRFGSVGAIDKAEEGAEDAASATDEGAGAEEIRRLPLIDACPKNFAGQDLAALDPAAVLDQEKLSLVLGALDLAFTAAAGLPRGERIAIAALLAER
jgi:uncharacterized protein